MTEAQLPLQNELYTIRASHYCERARFVLDLARIPYIEYTYMPGMHILPMKRLVGKYNVTKKADENSSPVSTPTFISTNGQVLRESIDVMKYGNEVLKSTQGLDLFPDEHKDEIQRIEKELHDIVGPSIRRVAYTYLVSPAALRNDAYFNVPRFQAFMFTVLSPLLIPKIYSSLNVTEESTKKALEDLRRVFIEMSKRLEEHEYILGDRPTCVDITFSCLVAPIVGIGHKEGYGAYLPQNNASEEGCKIKNEFKNTKACQHAHRIFREFRKEPIQRCEPIVTRDM